MFHASSLKHYCFQLLPLLLLMVRLVLFITKMLNELLLKFTMHLQQHYLITLTILEKRYGASFHDTFKYDSSLKSIDFSDNFYLFTIDKNVQCNREGYHRETDGHIVKYKYIFKVQVRNSCIQCFLQQI